MSLIDNLLGSSVGGLEVQDRCGTRGTIGSESWKAFSDYVCVDCGLNTFPGCPPPELAQMLMDKNGNVPLRAGDDCEIYFVRESVWKNAGMDGWGGCLCIGCLEDRIGRRLKPKDFLPDHPFNSMPGTARLLDRRGDQ